jgi:uncharacterized protein
MHSQSDPRLETIMRVLEAQRSELSARFKVRSLGVFGSFVRHEARLGSDLDLLVEFDTVPTLFEFVRLQNYLSDLLGLPVDLVMKSALKPGIGQVILAEVVPL